MVDVVREKINEIMASDSFKWFVTFRHPNEILENHRSYLVLEISLYVFALLTFKHAVKSGGRFVYLWFGAVLHGLVVESLSYLLPDIDNFWHAQSMVMLLGKRLPLHVVVLYPVFIYTAVAAVSRLKLKSWAEPFAVGLSIVLMDIPFDIIGIKFLFWTWHDTDPNIYDRHYWVPWTSYYFHASFGSSFAILFFGTRHLLCSSPSKFESDGFVKETVCTLISGLLAMPLGVLQFIPVYDLLHYQIKIHTEVCVFLLLSFYFIIVWASDRHPTKEARMTPNRGWFDELALVVFLHFPTYVLLALFESPESIRSVGLHEKTGDCSAISSIQTASGQVLSKKTFLCSSNYDEGYYDFHCLPGSKPPTDGLDWYTICGNAFPNHIEYVIVVSALSFIGLFVYVQMLGFSGRHMRVRVAKPFSVRVKKD